MDQEPSVDERTGEAEVARLLRDPAPIRVRAGAGEVDAAALKLDEEEHVVATQEGSLDREEVAGQDASSLLAQELAPSRPRAPWRRHGFVLAAQPGKSQGRPPISRARSPSRKKRQNVELVQDPTPKPGIYVLKTDGGITAEHGQAAGPAAIGVVLKDHKYRC